MYDHSRRTLTIASLAVLATFLDTTILYVAFPDITATFSNTSASELSWVLNAYTIVFAAMLIPAGKLADRIGHRKVFLAGSIVFTVASMACGLAPSAELLIVFRIVQAVGAAALIPSSLALVMHAFAHDQLPRAVAIWGAAGAVAGALGPTLGAAIVEGLGWRWAFFINLPVGIYTVFAGRKHLHESSDPDTRVPSLVGVVLIAAAAGLLSYGLVGTDDYGWLSARTLGVLAAGLLVLAAFVVHQRHTKAPALDLDLFRIANFRWANLAMLLFGTAFAALFFGSILFLTDVWRWSVLQAGFGVAPGPVVVGLVAPRAGKLAGRIGQRPLLIAGGILFASCGLLRLVTLGPDINYARDFLPSMLLSGLGVALVFPQLSSVVAQALPPGRAGVGGAVAQAVRQFGGTFGVALTVAFLGATGAVIDSFDPIWWLIVVGGLATSALVLPMRTSTAPRTAPANRPPSPPFTQENQHEHRRIRGSRHRRQPRPRRRILPHTPRPRCSKRVRRRTRPPQPRPPRRGSRATRRHVGDRHRCCRGELRRHHTAHQQRRDRHRHLSPRRQRPRRRTTRVRNERLRTPRAQPRVRTRARRERRWCHHQRAVGPVMAQHALDRHLLRLQSSRLVAHQLAAPRTRRPAHPGARPLRRLHGYRHDRRHHRSQIGPRRRRPPDPRRRGGSST